MITTKDLTKFFYVKAHKRTSFTLRSPREKITALNHVNLEIKRGECLGLIGPNGAGKTTFIKILSTLIWPDEGTAIIDGYDLLHDSNKIQRRIGLVLGEGIRAFYWRLSGRQNLRFFANLHGMFGKEADRKIDYVLNLFGLRKWKDKQFMIYSTGMKQKLGLARAFLTDPPILLLDEPTRGVDPIARYEIKKIMRANFKDKTVIWASHNLYEIEEMCDRISLLNNGKIIMEGKRDELRQLYGRYVKIAVELESSSASLLATITGAEIRNDHIVEIRTNGVSKTLSEITEVVKAHRLKIHNIKTITPTLEELFIKSVRKCSKN